MRVTKVTKVTPFLHQKAAKVTQKSYKSYECRQKLRQFCTKKLRKLRRKVTKVTNKSHESYGLFSPDHTTTQQTKSKPLRKLRTSYAKAPKVGVCRALGPFKKKKKEGYPSYWSTPPTLPLYIYRFYISTSQPPADFVRRGLVSKWIVRRNDVLHLISHAEVVFGSKNVSYWV
jgi:hypothetical protein